MPVNQLFRVVAPLVRNYGKQPFLRVGNFQKRQKLGKIILYPGYIHLVENGYIQPFAVVGFVHFFQKVGFVETLGKLVVITYKVGAFLPHRLYGNYRGRIAKIFAKRVRQRSFTRTRHTLQNYDMGNRHTGYKLADIPLFIIKF